jgi:acetylglutamate kinase
MEKQDEQGQVQQIDLGMVGEVVGVKTDVLEMFTQSDFIPVIAPLGVDEEGILIISMQIWSQVKLLKP